MSMMLPLVLAVLGSWTCMYVLILTSSWCRRVQVARALRRELSLPPGLPVRLEEMIFGRHHDSIREAFRAGRRCRCYTVRYDKEDGSEECYPLRGVFVASLPWLRWIDFDI